MNEAPDRDGRGDEGADGPGSGLERPRAASASAPSLAASASAPSLAAATAAGAPSLGASLDADGPDDTALLAHKMALIGSLVPGLVHDLNNPLSAIRAFSQLLSRDPRLPEDLRGDAELLVEAADRTRQVAIGVLEFARSRPPERHPTPLGPLVRSVVDLAAYALSGAQVSVSVDIPSGLPLVPVDRGQMQQVLLELTLGVIGREEREADGGTLTFSAAVQDDPASHVSLRLTRDRAVPHQAPRPDADMAARIISAHGGDLRREATGEATTWAIELPLGSPAPGERQASHASATDHTGRSSGPAPARADAAPAGTSATAARPRVLVLDDEPAVRRFLSKALSIAGCDAVEAETGAHALALLADPSIAGVLCDHRMAGMTGTEVYDAVVAARPDLGRRFAFMSGDIGNRELTEFAERHGLALLAKPFDLQGVARTVTTLLGRASAGPDRTGAG